MVLRRLLDRERSAAQRQVDDLNRQREAITTYLDELRSLLGGDPIPSRRTLEKASAAEESFRAQQAVELDEIVKTLAQFRAALIGR